MLFKKVTKTPKKEDKSGEDTVFSRAVTGMRWVFRVISSAADRFYWDNGFSKAASLAYTSLFSLVPFITLIFGILASFALSEEYVAVVEEFIIRNFVPADGVGIQLNEFLQNVRVNVSALNLPMLVFFIVSSILLINTIENAINETWQVFEARSWSHKIGAFSSIILITPILILSVYVFVTLRIEPLLEKFGAQSLHSIVHPLYNYLVPFLLMFAAFACLYYMIPKASVKFSAVVFGALFTSLVFVCAYWAFAIYIEKNASYEKLYGAIAAIPIFLFWLYIFWTIVLLGAEVTYQAQYLPLKGKAWKRSIYSMGDGQIVLAMQALVIICRSFLNGEKMPNYVEISDKLGCSSLMLKPTFYKLEHAGIISCSDIGDKRITLMRNPEKILLSEIKTILFGEGAAMRYPVEIGSAFYAFAGKTEKDVTLQDIVFAKN
ncbi:MAG: YihY/virulence factor BrkB family protein [Bdellovibrionota bacterium]|jgi:membrane protein